MPSSRPRAYRHSVSPEETVRRIVTAIRQRQAEGRAVAVTDYTTQPDTLAAVRALMEEAVCGK